MSLAEILADENKSMKEEVVTIGLPEFDCERIPFTSPRMNWCTYGGIPTGKLIEFYGEEHGGKTTSALDIVANFQAIDERKVLYVDVENGVNTAWARKLGVDVENMIIYRPTLQSAEQLFLFIEKCVKTGEVGLWVIDSIGSLLSAAELDEKKTYEDKTYAGISASLTRFAKKMEMLGNKYNCTGIGINQEREDLNSQWGGTKTPGGKAWKYLVNVRMRFSRGQYFDFDGKLLTRSAENPAGNIVLMNMTKNRTCPPTRRVGSYKINYMEGIDYLRDLVDVAVECGIIDQKGAWFTILDVESGEVLKDKLQGQSKVYNCLEEDEELRARVEELVNLNIEDLPPVEYEELSEDEEE